MKRNAFTLIELLIVISIIAVLSTVGFATFQGVQSKARDSTRKSDLQKLATALEIYSQQNNKYVVDSASGADLTSCDTSTSSTFYSTITGNISGGTLSDPSTKLAYCYISSNNGQSFRLFAKLENCSDSQIIPNINCPTASYNYSITSDNLTLAAADPADVVAPPTPAPSGSAPAPTSAPTSAPTAAPTAAPFPASGLLAYWKLDETSGTAVADSFDSKNGTANSSTNISISDKKLGTAARTFNGSSQNVNMGNVLNFNQSDPFSISVWLKKSESTGYGGAYLISKRHSSANGYAIGLSYGNYVNFYLYSSPSSYSRVVSSTLIYDTDSWHQVVVTYSGSGNAAGMNIYVDGSDADPVRRDENSSLFFTNSQPFTLASSSNNTNWFQGTLDEIGVWNRALTASEVSALYNSGAGLTYTP